MPTLSDLKNTVRSAIRSPHDGSKPRGKRRVISFKEALENLKNSQNGPITCSAFHSFGKCRKEISSIDSNLPAILDGLNMADVQTPIKLMPLMLCSAHWEKTVYYNALFLDWLSVYGSKQDTRHFENIVVDYQSAIAIDHKERASEEMSIPSITVSDDQRKPVSAPSSPTNNHSDTDLQPKVDQLQIHDESGPSELGSEDTCQNLPETSILVGMESYASIELGVAKLEILYQENLKCIAMSSVGWRCQEIISQDQLNKARELLNSSLVYEVDLDVGHLLELVLCPGHGLGQLPQIYSERWATFTELRMSKEEAMSKFNADFWMSVEFFKKESLVETREEPTVPINMRPRSASGISEHQCGNQSFEGARSTRTRLDIQKWEFQFSVPDKSPNPESLFPSRLSKTRSADPLNTKPVMLDMPSATSSPMVDPTTPIPEIRFSVGEFRDALGVAPKGKPTDGPAAKADVDAPSVPKVSPKETTLLEEQYSVQSESSSSSSLPEKAVRGSGQVQYIIDENLMKRIRSPIRTDSSVYIFTSFSGNTVKIGRDLDPIRHVQEIRGECQCQAFAGQGTLSFPNVKRNFERAINLVYLELENFRTKISCQNQQHGSSCGFENEHRKWFDVPESVALNSVKLWGDFVEEAYTDRGFLRGDWEKRLTLLPKPGETEILSLRAGDTTTHHRLRNARYRDWFNSKRSQQSV